MDIGKDFTDTSLPVLDPSNGYSQDQAVQAARMQMEALLRQPRNMQLLENVVSEYGSLTEKFLVSAALPFSEEAIISKAKQDAAKKVKKLYADEREELSGEFQDQPLYLSADKINDSLHWQAEQEDIYKAYQEDNNGESLSEEDRRLFAENATLSIEPYLQKVASSAQQKTVDLAISAP